jgi:hypothetical protein
MNYYQQLYYIIEDICLVQCKIGIYFTEWAPKGIFHEWRSNECKWTFGVHKVKSISILNFLKFSAFS